MVQKQLRCSFKCKCARYIHYKRTGDDLMKGEWDFHINILHRIYPQGLNREFYKFDFKTHDSEKIIHHYNPFARKF